MSRKCCKLFRSFVFALLRQIQIYLKTELFVSMVCRGLRVRACVGMWLARRVIQAPVGAGGGQREAMSTKSHGLLSFRFTGVFGAATFFFADGDQALRCFTGAWVIFA